MNTYHSADKEPSTLELTLSLRAMFTTCECSAFSQMFQRIVQHFCLIRQCAGVAHTIVHCNFTSPGMYIYPYLPHVYVLGSSARRQNESLFFSVASWGLQLVAFCYRTVSMKVETTKLICKQQNRYFTIGFLQISKI